MNGVLEAFEMYQSKWRFAKARPDPDFRYRSNRVA